LVQGLDGPGLAQLAGLNTRDMAAIMGLRSEGERLKLQKYRDVVNEMYQTDIGGKVRAETENLKPTINFKIGDQTIPVTRAEYLKLNQQRISAMSALEKEYRFYVSQTRNKGETPMSLEEYKIQNNTWVEQYQFYAAQQLKAKKNIKPFEQWVKEQRRAGALSIGQAASKAGAVAGASAKARTEEKYLGPDLRKDSVKLLQTSNRLFLTPDDEKEALIASEMEKLLGQTFGPENVSPLLDIPGKGRGWKIRKSDGTTVWKGISK